jgi:hypothetical protein
MIQHRKLYDRDPRIPPLVDKITAKTIVANLIGSEWIVPTLWTGTDPALIPFDQLTVPYVVKASHACECNVFVFDALDVDREHVRALAANWMRLDYSTRYHEWAYSQVPRRLLIEPLIGNGTALPVDYKFSVFRGLVHHVGVTLGRGTENRCDIHFDRAWTFLPEITDGQIDDRAIPEPPRHLSAMIDAAETLAEPFGFARVDLYDTDDRPLFGEITFYPSAGYLMRPLDYDRMLGDLWPRSSPTTVPEPESVFGGRKDRAVQPAVDGPGVAEQRFQNN